MRVLVTGAAGFIGFHLCEKLLTQEHEVVGLDNINNYYDVNLKFARLKQLGIDRQDAEKFEKTVVSKKYGDSFHFIRLHLEDRKNLPNVFDRHQFEVVVNLAAQAGVRYSLENPEAYIDSNIVGFLNILECCRHNKIKHLLYASSSSVYGQNKKVPFSVEDNVDHPISLYAATKKSNELMSYTYSHLYGITTTGLRFFTVYGPWGRPDMAMFLFTDAIFKGKPIKVFNNGDLSRDFTYIDDIINGIALIIEDKRVSEKYQLFNIGNSRPVELMEFIQEIEVSVQKQAKKEMLPMQPGDVNRTWADIDQLKSRYGYEPNFSVKDGINNYVNWYKEYYNI